MPPPPGYREIQHEELSWLFGRMVGVRLVLLPPLLGLALWLAWAGPSRWRKLLLLAVVSAILAFLVAEWVRWRRHGFTPGAVPRNLAIAVGAAMLLAFATGGLASPFLYPSVLLALVSGIFVPWPTNAVLAALQISAAWTFAGIALARVGSDPGLAAFGGAAAEAPRPWVLAQATMLSIVFAMATTVGRAVRWSFDRMVQRAALAQQESLRAHAERAEELTALSAEIAHELKNPLASVKGLAGLLAQHVPDGKGAERLQVLRREVDRMQAILDDFLNFSRPLVPLALGDTDVGALCREVAALHEGISRERSVEIAVRAAGGIAIRCDPRKARQVLINLLQNALDASPAGATVEIEAERTSQGGARVRVLDRGRGLEPGIGQAVFSPGVTTKAAGSGLGLTIARALARQHGGDVALLPRAGGGTAAELLLPAAPGAGRAA